MATDQSAANDILRQGLPKLGSTMPSRIEVVLNVDKLDRDLVDFYGLLETPTESAVKQVTLWLIKRTEYGGHCRRNDRLLSKGWRKGTPDGIDASTIPHWNVSQAISPFGIRPELIPEFRRRLADVMRSLLVFVRRSFNDDFLLSDHAADARTKIATYLQFRRIDVGATAQLHEVETQRSSFHETLDPVAKLLKYAEHELRGKQKRLVQIVLESCAQVERTKALRAVYPETIAGDSVFEWVDDYTRSLKGVLQAVNRKLKAKRFELKFRRIDRAVCLVEANCRSETHSNV